MQPNETYYDTSGVEAFVTLVCIAQANPAPSYAWFNTQLQKRIQVDPKADKRVTVTNGQLVINKPDNNKDTGDYQCVATNQFGSVLSNTVQIKFGCEQINFFTNIV